MREPRLLLGICVLAALGVIGPSAVAAAGPEMCSGQRHCHQAGTHGPIVVTGTRFFGPGTTTIRGNLTVAPGAALNDHVASSFGATVHVTGNVIVGKGAWSASATTTRHCRTTTPWWTGTSSRTSRPASTWAA
jgi:hypothetical protein